MFSESEEEEGGRRRSNEEKYLVCPCLPCCGRHLATFWPVLPPGDTPIGLFLLFIYSFIFWPLQLSSHLLKCKRKKNRTTKNAHAAAIIGNTAETNDSVQQPLAEKSLLPPSPVHSLQPPPANVDSSGLWQWRKERRERKVLSPGSPFLLPWHSERYLPRKRSWHLSQQVCTNSSQKYE